MKILPLRRRPADSVEEGDAYDLTLSVLVLTYNHQSYLAQALESALTQKTRFLFEIVIGDDCSTDSTRQIAARYQAAYPHKIRIVNHESNGGPARNIFETRRACRGKYLAILEGDDYWIDPNKLQRQVDLLEADASLSCCFHNVQLLQQGQVIPFGNAPYPQRAFTFADIARRNIICNCSTLVLRSRCFDLLPAWLAENRYYDWPMHVYNARQGDLGYVPEVMSIYRIHNQGAWHGAHPVTRIEAVLDLLRRMQRDIGESHEREFNYAIGFWRAELIKAQSAESAGPPTIAAARFLDARGLIRKVRRVFRKAA